MKQKLLKSIVNDLHLAGIFDEISENFMNADLIEKNELINSFFGTDYTNTVTQFTENTNYDETAINTEISNLFASFGSTSSNEKIELIETKKVTKTKISNNNNIVDPRLAKKFTDTTKTNAPSKTETIENFEPEKYITIQKGNQKGPIFVINAINNQEFKKSLEYNLLCNILKTIGLTYKQISIIFINDSYQKATLANPKATTKLANYLAKQVQCLQQGDILCFGQVCLDILIAEKTTVRNAQGKIFNLHDNKKVLANYSLSAILNSAKYKQLLWHNILTIK